MKVGITYNLQVATCGKEYDMATRRSDQQHNADLKHALRVSLKFNRIFDYEIVQWLKKQPNKQGAIKEAILFYINESEDM